VKRERKKLGRNEKAYESLRESMKIGTEIGPPALLRPSPYDQWVGISNQVTRLRAGSLALRPAALSFGNSRPSVARTPLPRATGVYGQFPGRDSNPLDQTVVTAYGHTYTLDNGRAKKLVANEMEQCKSTRKSVGTFEGELGV
jgi:hypothetical protein